MAEIELDTLLTQDKWIRRMAHRLICDPALGDDLAQEAWLASLSKQRVRAASRPWLLGVLSNKASTERRDRRRAADKIRAAAQEKATTSQATDEVVADIELRERLAHEILALDEPVRNALHHVYFLGLTMEEAGRRLGTSRSTVHVRVHQGLAVLRARLDGAYGSDRRAWATVLLPLALPDHLPESAAPAEVAAASTSTQTPIMLATKTAAIVATVLSLSFLTRQFATGSHESTTGLPAVEVHSGRAGDATSASAALAELNSASEANSRAPLAAAPAQATEAHISGVFLRPDGQPAAGATWYLSGWQANAVRVAQFGLPTDWETLRGTLDASGELDVTFTPPQAFQFVLDVQMDGAANEGWRWAQLRPGEARELGTVQLLQGCSIQGTIVDANGAPLLGHRASVMAEEVAASGGGGRERRSERTSVDPATGTFELTRVPPGPVSITASGVCSTIRAVTVNAVPGDNVNAELPIDPKSLGEGMFRLKVQVKPFFLPHAPAPLEHVYLEGASGERIHATSYARGSRTYLFEQVPDGEFTAVIEDPDLEPVRLEHVAAGMRQHVNVFGTAGVRLAVTDSNGQPVTMYSVAADLEGAGRTGKSPVLHDGASALVGGELRRLIPGTYTLHLRTAEWRASVAVVDLLPGEVRDVAIELAPTIRVSGRVTRTSGDAIASEAVCLMLPADQNDSEEVRVALYPGGFNVPTSWRRCVQLVQSADDGSFEFEVDTPGRYLLFAGSQGRPYCWGEVFELEVGEQLAGQDLVLDEPGRIEGTFEVPSHLPQDGWSIQLIHPATALSLGSGSEAASLDALGRFVVDSVAPGTVEFYARRTNSSFAFGADGRPIDAYFLAAREVGEGALLQPTLTLASPVPGVVEFDLQPSGDIEGKLQVHLWPVGAGPVSNSFVGRGSVRELAPIICPGGRYTVEMRGDGWIGYDTREIIVSDNAAYSLSLPMDPVRQRVQIMRNGEPVADLKIQIMAPEPDVIFRRGLNLTTDSDGWCEPALTTGTWWFAIQDASVFGTTVARTSVTWPPAVATVEL